MKKTKIIVPALGMLLLSTAASVTGTVAWFSANNKVNVTGMSVSTQVKGNLLIATSNSSDANYDAANLDATIPASLLEPVSTVNGSTFFYTTQKVKGDGSTTVETFASYTNDDNATTGNGVFNTAYGTTGAVGYVDYNFYIKATSDIANQNVIISDFNLLYDGNALVTTAGKEDRAWRVAVFADPVAETNTSTAATTLKSILGPASAAYFDNKAVAVASGDSKYAAVSNFGSRAILGTIVAKGTTQRYRVVVRLYLEGNDTTCKNDTYAELTQDYQLALTVELGKVSASDAEGANVISSTKILNATKEGTTATVALANTAPTGTTMNSYQWQKKNEGVWADIPSATSASYTGSSTDVLRCKVVTSIGTYFSNSQIL